MTRATNVGRYLIQRLEQAGVQHVFGIPGDYVIRFFDLLVDSEIQVVGMCAEAGAGFAADAYARINGLGVLCVTYCVGGLSTVNAVAGAYAEKSPLVVISGSPALSERSSSSLLHHQVRGFRTQLEIFEKMTVAGTALEDPATAGQQIDACLAACVRFKRPVYIELPRDVVDRPCQSPLALRAHREKSDVAALQEAVHEAADMLRSANRPVILAGVEIHRFGLQEQLLKLVQRTGYPVAATLLGKSVISERHTQYLGVYEGAMGREQVRRVVESADCVLILGAFMTDINLGIYTANLDESRAINVTSERVSIKHHHFENIVLKDFITGLTKSRIGPRRRMMTTKASSKAKPFRAQTNKAVTVRRFFERMNDLLDEDTIVIADIGDSLFGAADLTIHRRTEFISPAYYTSMGFAVPAAVGAQIGNRRLRPIVFVGDGAFQMTGHELGSVSRYDLNPIVFVLNNKGYTTERFIHEGPYNDIHEWAYHLWPQLTRKGWGAEVRKEGELEEALDYALANTKSYSIINVHLDPLDRSQALDRLGRRLRRRVGCGGDAIRSRR